MAGPGLENVAGQSSSQIGSVSHQSQTMRPQMITGPVHILQLSSPKGKETVMTHTVQIPKKIVQVSSGAQDRTKGPCRDNDKAKSSKVRQRCAGTRDKESLAAKAQGRPKKQRTSQQPKIGRVINLQIPSRPVFKSAVGRAQQRRAKDTSSRAKVNLSSDGFYEVAVRYDHCQNIAVGCGVQTDQVAQALFQDNEQRCSAARSEEDPDQDMEGPNISFGSEEDMGSDEELL